MVSILTYCFDAISIKYRFTSFWIIYNLLFITFSYISAICFINDMAWLFFFYMILINGEIKDTRSVIFVSGFLILYRIPFVDHYDNTQGKSTSLLNRAVIINSPLLPAPKSTRHTTQNRGCMFVRPLTAALGT